MSTQKRTLVDPDGTRGDQNLSVCAPKNNSSGNCLKMASVTLKGCKPATTEKDSAYAPSVPPDIVWVIHVSAKSHEREINKQIIVQ